MIHRIGNTPARLRLLLAGNVVLALILGGVVLSSAFEHRQATHDIGVDAAPSVVSAHNIKTEIESLDSDLISEMLVPPGGKDDWIADFHQNRVEIGRHILAATRSAFGADEHVPIEKLEDALGKYLMAAEAARDAHVYEGADAAIRAYRESFQILETELVPAATELNAISDTDLEETYEHQEAHSRLVQVLVIALGAGLLAMLFVTQLYVRRRFRRQFSPILLAATVAALALPIYTVGAFRAHAEDLTGLKHESYDSVDRLLAARADAYEASSSRSRWLFERANAAQQAQRFTEYANKLLALQAGQTFESVAQLVRQRHAMMETAVEHGTHPAAAGKQARDRYPLVGASGDLKIALDNITFPSNDLNNDEPTQAANALHQFGVYAGLGLGTQPVESRQAFAEFDKAIGRWIEINQGWMTHYTDACFADVAKLPFVGPGLAFAVMLLVFLGLRPRLKEYG